MQVIARSINDVLIAKKKRRDFERQQDRIESLVDVWMALEHPRAYEIKEAQEEQDRINAETNKFNMLAPDMATMLAELRRVASMDSDETGE